MSDLVTYDGFIASSDRWEAFAVRDDDIVVTTPSKSGTTWMQTLVALPARYDERVAELAGDPELVAWVQVGWLAGPADTD